MSTFFTLFTSNVMEKNILGGYWALKRVFGHSKSWFRWYKNTVPNVICNIVSTKKLNFYRINPQVKWYVFGRHHSSRIIFDLMDGDRTDRCSRANNLFVSPSRLKKWYVTHLSTFITPCSNWWKLYITIQWVSGSRSLYKRWPMLLSVLCQEIYIPEK